LQQEARLRHDAFADPALYAQQGAPFLDHNLRYRYDRAHCIPISNGCPKTQAQRNVDRAGPGGLFAMAEEITLAENMLFACGF
jgi:hypothetical protein